MSLPILINDLGLLYLPTQTIKFTHFLIGNGIFSHCRQIRYQAIFCLRF